MKRFFFNALPELSLGVLLTFSACVGQTFFISLFAREIRDEFNLSHGIFGTFYSTATLASAVTFLWLGKFTDQFDLRLLGAFTFIALSGFAIIIANANTPVILFLSLFGLRLLGQSLLGHIAVISMARWFLKERGKALSIASLGHSIGEAILPILIAIFLTLFTWREIWIGVSICMIVIFFPILCWLTKFLKHRALSNSKNHLTKAEVISANSWNRSQVLKDLRFYLLMPGILSSPFIITGILFHQVHLVETKSWSLKMFASCYPLFALSTTIMTLATGWIVDKLGSINLLRFYLLPLGVGLVLLASTDETFAAPLFMVLMGASAGAANIVLSTLWVELYGNEHLGSIRSMCFAMLVLSTSLASGLMGFLIDTGITLKSQLVTLSIYIFLCSIGFAILTPSLLKFRSPPSIS